MTEYESIWAGEREELHTSLYRAARPLEPRQSKFPEVTGLCRGCKHAHITRKAYSEMPTVVCQANYERVRRMPLDITECTEYSRRGELALRELAEMALLIDPRHNPGQFL